MPVREPWESDDSPPFIPQTFELPEDDTWKGDVHQDDWPEDLAGPEYWLFKKQRDSED